MKAGDVLNELELPDLPLRSVIVCDEGELGHNVLIRVALGFDWYNQGEGGISHLDRDEVVRTDGPWTVVYVPPVPAPALGDIVNTEAQARVLPVGSVMVDPLDPDPESRPAVKVGRNLWMYHEGPHGDVQFHGDDLADDTRHTIVYLPVDADTGTVGTAA